MRAVRAQGERRGSPWLQAAVRGCGQHTLPLALCQCIDDSHYCLGGHRRSCPHGTWCAGSAHGESPCKGDDWDPRPERLCDGGDGVWWVWWGVATWCGMVFPRQCQPGGQGQAGPSPSCLRPLRNAALPRPVLPAMQPGPLHLLLRRLQVQLPQRHGVRGLRPLVRAGCGNAEGTWQRERQWAGARRWPCPCTDRTPLPLRVPPAHGPLKRCLSAVTPPPTAAGTTVTSTRVRGGGLGTVGGPQLGHETGACRLHSPVCSAAHPRLGVSARAPHLAADAPGCWRDDDPCSHGPHGCEWKWAGGRDKECDCAGAWGRRAPGRARRRWSARCIAGPCLRTAAVLTHRRL